MTTDPIRDEPKSLGETTVQSLREFTEDLEAGDISKYRQTRLVVSKLSGDALKEIESLRSRLSHVTAQRARLVVEAKAAAEFLGKFHRGRELRKRLEAAIADCETNP